MEMFRGEYSSELNTEDKHTPDLAILRHKAVGGTMALWKRSIDKYISVFPVLSTAFLPIIYTPPHLPVSAHIAIYLPTAGKDAEFLEEITELSNCINAIGEKYADCLVFIRGDGNVNQNNIDRVKIFSHFLSTHNLINIPLDHKTYHHFLGGGAFDSSIDILIHSKESLHTESVSKIFCQKDYPDIDSHHDPILSHVQLPHQVLAGVQDQELLAAPRINHHRYRIDWSEEGINNYEQLVGPQLSRIRQRWLNPSSKSSISVLLATTNNILSKAAIQTNKAIDLNSINNLKSKKKPLEIRISEKNLVKAHKKVATNATVDANKLETLKSDLKLAKLKHRKSVRSVKNQVDNTNDK